MTAPVVLLIAVATSPNGVEMTRAAAAACVESMQPGARSITRVVSTAPSDVDAIAEASALGADALVLLTWNDAAFLTTDVRASVVSPATSGGGWAARTVVFSARDQPAERGRTLGLVVASMLEERWGTAPPTRTVAASPASAPVDNVPVGAPASPAPVAGVTTSVPDAVARWALEADVTTIVDGEDGFDIDTVGGTVALRRAFGRPWALRAGLGFRVADVDGADATTRTALGMFGVAWSSPGLGRPHEIGFGARLDILGVHEEIKRDVEGSSSPDSQGYWSLGFDLLGQIGYGLSRGTALLLGGGPEETLTAADVVVAGQRVATISHQRLVLEIGVLSRF